MKTFCCIALLICILFSQSFAQIPSGAILHLSADLGLTESSGRVIQWNDLNKPTIKFFAPDTSNRPTSTLATINGHKTVSFDGVTNYLEGSNIFPVNQDYTVVIVTRITNFGVTNNIVSGTTHAIFLGGGVYPRFLHANFNTIATSTAPLTTSPAVIVARFNQSNLYGSFYVNGSSGDSAMIGANTDSTVYLGSFARGNFMGGDLAEVFIYPRYISDTERAHIEESLFKKYAIVGPQPPDLTFSEAPRAFELYPRGKDDSATVNIKATLKAKGFDSVYLKVLRNFGAFQYFSKPLNYTETGASFSFAPRIHAELSEYTFIVGVKSSTKDSVLTRRDSIVCGDVYFIDGQSNSIFGGDSYSNEYCRTFGGNNSQSKSDTSWSLSTASGYGGGSNVGNFGMRIQRDFVENMGMPTAVICGGVGGTTIESHLPDIANPINLQTYYGSMLYRALESDLATHAKAVFWYQGESNSIANYFDNFKRLSNSWRLDYPNIKKIYVVQVRPGCAAPGNSSELRDLMRTLPRSFPDVVAHTTMGLPGHDGCHFVKTLDGYHFLGDQLFSLLQRDFYHSTDTIGINSPDVVSATYTDDTHRTIKLLFNTSGSGMVIPADSTIDGVTASIKDYFFIGTDTSIVTSVQAHGDTLFLQLSRATNARTIAYLPDTYYNGTSVIYEGPWLANNRGLGASSFWGVPITYNLEVSPSNDFALETPFVIFPNPASNEVTFKINLKAHSHIRLTLFDELGREVLRAVDDTRDAGSYQLSLDTHTLSSSSIIARLEIDGHIIEKRLVILR